MTDGGRPETATWRRLSTNNGESVSEGNPLPVMNMSELIPDDYDEINLTYVASGNGVGEIETVTYKKDSTTIATLTLSYNSDNKLSSVVKS